MLDICAEYLKTLKLAKNVAEIAEIGTNKPRAFAELSSKKLLLSVNNKKL